MQFRLRTVFIILVFTLFTTAMASAATLTLAWDASNDGLTAGYFVKYGTTSGVYVSQVDARAATTYEVTGLTDGTRYCFVVRGYSAAGALSGNSNEVCATTSGTAAAGGSGGSSGGGSSSVPGGSTTGGSTVGGSSAGGSSSPSTGGTSVRAGSAGSFALNATVREDRFVDLSWAAAPGGATAYRVEFGRAPGQTAVSSMATGLRSSFDLSSVNTGDPG